MQLTCMCNVIVVNSCVFLLIHSQLQQTKLNSSVNCLAVPTERELKGHIPMTIAVRTMLNKMHPIEMVRVNGSCVLVGSFFFSLDC